MTSRVIAAATALAAVVLVVSGVTAGPFAKSTVPCQLALKIGPRRSENPPGQFHINLVFINQGFASCRLHGSPDVELIGPDDPSFGSLYAIPKAAATSEIVNLAVGRSAHAVLTWLPPSSGRRWNPGYVRVVVPTAGGASFPMAIPWRLGPVLRQDEATRPGTFVGPVRRGAS